MRALQAQLDSAPQHIEGLMANIVLEANARLRVTVERSATRGELSLKQLVADLEHHKLRLTYDGLRPGGVLGNVVKEFTFFPDSPYTDAFLEVINFTHGCKDGKSLCENLVCYSRVSINERRDYQHRADEACAEAGSGANSSDSDRDIMTVSVCS